MKRIGTRRRGERGEASVHVAIYGSGLLRTNARERNRDAISISRRVVCAFRLRATRYAGQAALVRRSLGVGGCITFLAGCTTVASPLPAQCIPLTAWTSAQQDEMRKEYDALPKDAILRAVFMDWVGMRDADRACMSAGEK